MATRMETITEGVTPIYRGTLKDENGIVVPGSVLLAARLTVYVGGVGTIVNARDNQNVKNANDVTISEAGAIVWKLREADTILPSGPKPGAWQHWAVFVFEWEDAQSVPRQIVHEVIFPIRRATNAPFTA